LNSQVTEVKKEIDNINDRREQLKSETSKLEMEKQELESEIEMKKR
jgi:predicted  nucleic acid-binding Zn-ribbon protein